MWSSLTERVQYIGYLTHLALPKYGHDALNNRRPHSTDVLCYT